MDKICHIHIGIHKTGSTSLQHYFAQKRTVLAKNGYFVPLRGNWAENMCSHHNFAFQLNKDTRYNPAHGDIQSAADEVREAGCPPHVILSSEDLCFTVARYGKAAELAAPFEQLGYRIEWIVYFRWFPEWADSAYAEIVKGLRTGAFFQNWIKTLYGQNGLTIGFHPTDIYNSLSVNPNWTVRIRPFAAAVKRGLVPDFFDAIGFTPPPKLSLESPHLNSRNSWLQVEYFRRGGHLVHRHQLQASIPKFLRHYRAGAAAFERVENYCGLNDNLAAELDKISKTEYETILRQAKWEGTFEDFFPKRSFRQHQYSPATAPAKLDERIRTLVRKVITPELIHKFGKPVAT